MITNAPNINHLWAQLIVEELIRCGVSQFFIAPGSRSTPLVTAIARNPAAQAVVHFDERGNAFAALGYARASKKTAVWVTTSGTALANGLPAVIEASIESVPLIMLTADRPPELRQTGANQTIVQPGIYGRYTVWDFDGPVPDPDISPAFILTTVDQAVQRANDGPVHLNWMFREPLDPREVSGTFEDYLIPISPWLDHAQPFTAYAASQKTISSASLQHLLEILNDIERGVIIAGRMSTREEGEAVQRLAEKLGWPLLPDVGAQIADPAGSGNVIHHFDFLFDDKQLAGDTQAVFQFGKRGTSKKMLAWLQDFSMQQYVVIDALAERIDPLHQTTLRVEADIEAVCKSLLENLKSSNALQANWLARWRDKDAGIDDTLSHYFEQQPELSEPGLARALSEMLVDEQILVLGNSMPVRDMDVYGRSEACGVQTILNRGASGIDGTIATAFGAAVAGQKTTTLYIGDLSVLHDLNSLALLKSMAYPFIIVIVNNDGGGIFSFLPISSYKDVFEPYFAAPHGVNFEGIAETFGLAYEQPKDLKSFKDVYRHALDVNGCTLIEVQTNREQNLAIHKVLAEHISAR